MSEPTPAGAPGPIECPAPECRFTNPPGAAFCGRCGRTLSEAAAPDAVHEEYELPIEGFKGTADEIERQWFEKCYKGRGDRMAQLTLRAVLMGSVLGGVLSLTNIYIGLKAGWGFGVAITACILSYAIWTTFYRLRLVRTPMTILENNCMQSTASAAGYSTGGTLISAFAAFILLNDQTLPIWLMLAWVFFLAVLGVTMAIPMKRTMINVEQLRFPTGVAAAETLKALHSHGDAGMRSAIALGVAGGLAGLSKFLSEGLVLIGHWLAPYQISSLVTKLNLGVFGQAWMGRTVMFTWEPMFIAAGAITGIRVCTSMLIGGVLCWMCFVPWLQSQGVVSQQGGFRELVQYTLWGGTACMVTSGLLSFALQWRSAMRAFTGLGGLFGGSAATQSEIDRIETPTSWFIVGQIVALAGIAWLANYTFGMPYWQSVLAVVLTFALALVACRVTGETDTTPIGAMGKIMQLTFGIVHPAKTATDVAAMNVNLMAANITAGAAGSSADLLTDLKSGYLLGANPRKQFIAQFCGIFAGTLITVMAFSLLVPNAAALGTDQFPAPAAQAWKGVAEAMAGLREGLWKTLGPIKVWSIVIGGLVGLLLPILSMVLPARARVWVPSAAGLGLAWVFHWYYALLFFLGAVIGWAIEKARPQVAKEYTFPVASGVIAGESLMGVVIVFVENGPQMWAKLFG